MTRYNHDLQNNELYDNGKNLHDNGKTCMTTVKTCMTTAATSAFCDGSQALSILSNAMASQHSFAKTNFRFNSKSTV